MEFHSDAIAVVRQSLGVNHLRVGRIFMQGSNPCHFARLPGVLREYASAVWTDVIGERPFVSVGTRTFRLREAYYDDDRQSPFHSAIGPIVQRDLAQTLTGQTRGVAAC